MNTGRALNDMLTRVLWLGRRIDPLLRPAIDKLVRPPLQGAAQWVVRHRLPDPGPGLARERRIAGEEQIVGEIIATMEKFLRREYGPGQAQRAGNTKTYGVVRGEFEVPDSIPEDLRHGLFARPGTYRAWVRLAGPGPLAPADLHDNAIMSIGVKVTGVPGTKLIEDEKNTQDFLGISAPTFTTPDVRENLQLQQEVWNRTPLLYFIRPGRSHWADLIMQGLYAKTAASPLQATYYSCVPYLLGAGQAVQFRFVVRPFPFRRVPLRPGPDYLREALATTLAERDVIFDMLVQVQTDPRRMPIEHAGVVWPERLSPPVPVAVLRLPRQHFDSPAQRAFADNLSFNPWHALLEHRPLGNQNRARLAIYTILSRVRQQMNAAPPIEPTGSEEFPAKASAR
ncbi:hypothetical protein QFZ65_002447 [Arthrobacter sp. B3I9]|uniref:catalase family protein n=1 Tax=Arthrobacter sp. B3I9 TaxID=3042270 RepID=UPI00278DC4EE|nr:catalase family protein [Arthrobacter sp. B3I9]MDQ0850509.1 hypothetical protein [Arthrobacter sp. B3I9]